VKAYPTQLFAICVLMFKIEKLGMPALFQIIARDARGEPNGRGCAGHSFLVRLEGPALAVAKVSSSAPPSSKIMREDF
jgi:hypothetical protein